MIELFPDLHDRPKTRDVLRSLMRHVCSTGMQPGEKFPTQPELRELFGFHNNTLTPAMKILEECGLLERRRKYGTVLRREVETTDIPGLWRVGMAISEDVAITPFYGQLFHFLHHRLRQAGITLRHYISSGVEEPGVKRFSKFDQLDEDLSEARLDLVLSMVGLPAADVRHWEERHIPVVHVGSDQSALCGAIIEQSRMVREAVALLAGQGVRRIALVCVKDGHDGFWKAFRHAMGEFELPCEPHQLHLTGTGPQEGRRVSERILSLPKARRPEALIITDDRVASGLAAFFANESTYRPTLIVRTNRQAPLAFALPVMHFEMDIDELARQAADLCRHRLLDPSAAPRRIFVGTKLADKATSYLR